MLHFLIVAIYRKEIGSKLKLLVILSLAGCPRVTMANLLYLCGCVSLEVCYRTNVFVLSRGRYLHIVLPDVLKR
jgi:hypothetical protein